MPPLPFTATAVARAITAVTLGLAACHALAADGADTLRRNVKNVVVIYAENRSFDSLFGHFPGADGLSTVLDGKGQPTAAYVPQKDRDGRTVLRTLPPTWGGVTAPGSTPGVTQAQSAGLANAPFAVETAFQTSANATLSTATVTRDLYHRFYENQMQINGGKNDLFAAWADAGGLTMGTFDYSGSALFKLAQQYVLADHFFQGAFGGSFLNHQYLVCACAPEYPHADTAPAAPPISVLDVDALGRFMPQLATRPNSPASAMDGPPRFIASTNLTPRNYAGDGKIYAVNTMQPAYQPSGNAPASQHAKDLPYANTDKATTLPPQNGPTIADLLDRKGVSWKWYSGAWNAAVADGTRDPSQPRSVIYAANPQGVATTERVDFQTHHQPFNYYAKFDPVKARAYRNTHLKDYDDFMADAAAGKLPAVSFYKPEGLYNQHPGYTNADYADSKIADTIAQLQASPQWKHMVIVLTYDEYGGQWDHVAPPKGDWIGPGTRIPALVISPFAKKGTVDHTPYDTGSVLRLIARVWGLPALPGIAQRDAALKANGAPAMGDLTSALQF